MLSVIDCYIRMENNYFKLEELVLLVKIKLKLYLLRPRRRISGSEA